MTGKAAGSAGVCTTDTCLDSITGSESHSFLPIKTEKTTPTLASPPAQVLLLLLLLLLLTPSACRIGNCFEPSKAAISHPPFALFSSLFPLRLLRYGHPSYRSSRYVCEVPEHVRGRPPNVRVRGGGSFADAFRSFISFLVHLPTIRDLDRRSQECYITSTVVETFLYFVRMTINARWPDNF